MKTISFIIISVFLLATSFFSVAIAKNERAFIFLKNGTQIEADIEMPKIDSKELTYRNEKNKKVIIASDSILFMTVWNKKVKEMHEKKIGWHMVYTPYYKYDGIEKEYKLQDKVWIIRTENRNNIASYIAAGKYMLSKGMSLKTIPDKHHMDKYRIKYYYWVLFQRPEEKYPTLIFQKTIRYKNMPEHMFYYKNYGQEYLKHCPVLLKYIEMMDFKLEELFHLAKYYERHCK